MSDEDSDSDFDVWNDTGRYTHRNDIVSNFSDKYSEFDEEDDRLRYKPLPQRKDSGEFDHPLGDALKLVHVQPDGNCLFHCYVLAINSVWPDLRVTVRDLRKVVANRSTESEFEVAKALYDAAIEEKDYELLAQVSHMQGVRSLEDYKRVLQTSSFWGNEQCFFHLRKFSGLVPVVITLNDRGRAVVSRQIYDETSEDIETKDSNLYILLLLKSSHYWLISLRGQYVIGRDLYEEFIKYVD
ncbi:hypothetical protein [Sicyoidochytrium minutum DNA virus]|nr:hypothetical protein [Sicyoidochytrium minutum DNA virus]